MISKSVLPICLILAISVSQISGVLVDLKLSASDLPPMDIFDGPPDPYAVVYYSASLTSPYTKVGQTQYYDDVWGAEWPENFSFEYTGTGSQQRIKIDVMDYDWDEDDMIGYVEFNLSDVVNSFGNILERPINGPKNQGVLTIKGQVGKAVVADVVQTETEVKDVKSPVLIHQAKREDIKTL